MSDWKEYHKFMEMYSSVAKNISDEATRRGTNNKEIAFRVAEKWGLRVNAALTIIRDIRKGFYARALHSERGDRRRHYARLLDYLGEIGMTQEEMSEILKPIQKSLPYLPEPNPGRIETIANNPRTII
jgi:hypothetical protein